jgi:hypothetical protein
VVTLRKIYKSAYISRNMNIVSPELLEKIDEAKKRIDERKLDMFVSDMFNNLAKESIFYASIQDSDNERRGEVVENFEKAWKYGTENYTGEFTFLILTDIAGKVEPGLCQRLETFASFRTGLTTVKNLGDIPGSAYTPPSDKFRIEEHLDHVCKTLSRHKMHPVEEALFLYFHLVRIQPFDNGNKRTANAIMNLTLRHNGFPTIYITPNERTTYAALMQGAIKGFKEQGSRGNGIHPYLHPEMHQWGLYDYLAGKVLHNLSAAEDQLKCLPHYQAELYVRDPGVMFATKRRMDAFLRTTNVPYMVRLNREEKNLTVVARVPFEAVDGCLSRCRGLKYGLRTLPGGI